MEAVCTSRLTQAEDLGSLQGAEALRAGGDYHLVFERYRQVLEAAPDNAEALHALGVLSLELGMIDTALDLLNDAIRIDPLKASYHKDIGLAYRAKGKVETALQSFQHAIQCDHHCAEAYFHLGSTLPKPQFLSEALVCFQMAVRLCPDRPEYLYNLGRCLHDLGQIDPAIDHYRKALALRPDLPPALLNLAMALKERGLLDEALALCDQVLTANPTDPLAHNNRGIVLKNMNRCEDAIASFHQAINIFPNYVDAHLNLAVVLRDAGRIEEALVHTREAIRSAPTHAEAHWNHAFLLLMKGDFEEGWKKYEWRWRMREYHTRKRDFVQPCWSGEPLSKRIILLHAEQGIGDTIQFIRYARCLAQQGARVVVECPPSLTRLLATIPEIESVVEKGASLPAFDFHAPLMSLPRLLDTRLDSIPHAVPYLFPKPDDHLPVNLFSGKGLRVGIVWGGNPTHLNDQQRSIPLTALRPLLEIPGVQFFSLQVGPQQAALSDLPASISVKDLSPWLRDMHDTAVAASQMDLIVSVDTAVAHLAGALNKPVWLLLPFAPDWRWMLHRPDSPWYPSMRLFRQTTPGDWAGVVDKARLELHRGVQAGRVDSL